MKVSWGGIEPRVNSKWEARHEAKRGRLDRNPSACSMHASRESAGNTRESAGKAVASAMKVAAKSAGNVQNQEQHEDLHYLHARFSSKNEMFQKRDLCITSQRSNIRHG